MTDDLVKRLRDKVEASKIYDDDEELLDEAADRIEMLEAALREIAKTNNRRDRFISEIDAIIVNALGDKNEDA